MDFIQHPLPLHLYILLHLKRAGVDYAKMISKVTGIEVDVVNRCIEDLIKAGYVERDEGTAIKRSRARFKRAFEVRKHHKYYKLTREGEMLVRSIDDEWLRKYFDSIAEGMYEKLKELCENKKIDAKKTDREVFENLKLHKLVTENGKRTKFFEAFLKFAFVEFC